MVGLDALVRIGGGEDRQGSGVVDGLHGDFFNKFIEMLFVSDFFVASMTTVVVGVFGGKIILLPLLYFVDFRCNKGSSFRNAKLSAN